MSKHSQYDNPEKVFKRFLKLAPTERDEYVVSLLREMPLGIGGSAREFLGPALIAIRYYGDLRREGRDLNRWNNYLLPGTIFISMWGSRYRLSEGQRELIFDEIRSIHLDCLNRTHVVGRCEFVFLTLWSGNFDWAMPHRAKYLQAKHGMEELAELLEITDPRAAILAFIGGSGLGTSWRRSDQWDSVSEAGIGRYQYDYEILPRSDELYAGMMRFVLGE